MSSFIKEQLADDISQMVLSWELDLCPPNLGLNDMTINVISYAIYGYIASCSPSACEWVNINRDVKALVGSRVLGDPIEDSIIAIIDTYLKE